MTAFHYAVPASCLAVLLSTTGALAQVTAEQVWEDWKANMGVYGTEGVTIGSEAYADGVLTVTDLGFSLVDEETTISGNLAELVLTEQADGTVAVTMSDTYPITVQGTDDMGSVTDMALSLNQTGMAMTVSGEPGNLTYDLSIPRYELVVDELVTDGTAVPMDAVIGMTNVTGSYVTSGDADLRDIAYDLAIEAVDVKVSATEPGTQNAFTLNGTIAGVSGQTTMSMPAGMETADPSTIFASGFALDGEQTIGATTMAFTMNDGASTAQGNFAMTGGSLSVAIDQSALDYGFAFQGLTVDATSADMPFPVSFAASELALSLGMPMSPTDAPADFYAYLNLAELTVNDEVWGMFDPGAILPRDPATVTVDLTGTATMLVDLMAQDSTGMAEMSAPGLINSLDVNDITVILGGADVHATGAFTFDNDDMTTFPGMPRPTGKLDIALNGVNGLVEKLVQLGVVPAEQVMGVSMMLGMFAVPVGDDQLTSTIEVTADGQLLANGQRLQ